MPEKVIQGKGKKNKKKAEMKKETLDKVVSILSKHKVKPTVVGKRVFVKATKVKNINIKLPINYRKFNISSSSNVFNPFVLLKASAILAKEGISNIIDFENGKIISQKN